MHTHIHPCIAVEDIVSAIYHCVRRAQESKELLALRGDAPLLAQVPTRDENNDSFSQASGSPAWMLTAEGKDFLPLRDSLQSPRGHRYKKNKGCRAPGADLCPPRPPPARTMSLRVRQVSMHSRTSRVHAVAPEKRAHVSYFYVDVATLEQADEHMAPIRVRMTMDRIAAHLNVRMHVIETGPVAQVPGNTRFLLQVNVAWPGDSWSDNTLQCCLCSMPARDDMSALEIVCCLCMIRRKIIGLIHALVSSNFPLIVIITRHAVAHCILVNQSILCR
jgi:hypothetical protein